MAGSIGARVRGVAGLAAIVALLAAVLVVSAEPVGAVVDGGVVAWGANGSGQVGDGTTTTRPAPVDALVTLPPDVVSVGAAFSTSYAVRANGTLLGWGDNSWARLGVASPFSIATPVAVAVPAQPDGGIVTQVAVGSSHQLALTSTGKVLSWGGHLTGELGRPAGQFSNNPTPTQVTIPGDPTFVDIAAGAQSSAAVTASGAVWTWGTNLEGQLGNGSFGGFSATPLLVNLPGGALATHVAIGDRTMFVSTHSGAVLSWGAGSNGQLGNGTQTVRQTTPVFVQQIPAGSAVDVGAGVLWGFAILADGNVRSWGANLNGSLGTGNTASTGVAVPVQLPVGTRAIAASGGNTSSVVLTEAGQVLTFGGSANGALGRSTSTTANPVPLPAALPAGAIATSVAMGNGHVVAAVEQDTPPTVTISTPADASAISYAAGALADYACTDGQGAATCVGDVPDGQPIDLSTLGPKTFTVTSTDGGGQTTTVTHGYTVVDDIAPTITPMVPGPGSQLELGSVVAADYTCADDFLVSCTGTVPPGGLVDTSTVGDHELEIVATDGSGEPGTSVVLTYHVVDTTQPTVQIARPTAGEVIEAGTTVLADYACADLDLDTCTGTVADGAAVVTATLGPKPFSVTARDHSGNEATGTAGYTVTDTVPPVVLLASPVAGATHGVGSSVVADYSCADLLLADCVGTVPDGAPIDTATPGAKIFSVTGTDTSGNPTTVTRSYTVTSGTTLVASPAVANLLPSLLNLNVSVTLTFQARLTAAGGAPLPGRTVTFRYVSGATACAAVTNGDGVARCGSLTKLLPAILSLGYGASYAGDGTYESSAAQAGIVNLFGGRLI